jgi:hypothetical protein
MSRILVEGVKEFGTSWIELSRLLPGRPENHCKNRWVRMIQSRGAIQSVNC